MDARGLLDETLIVWMGEFGRSPKVNEYQAIRPRRPRPLAQCTRSCSPAAASTRGAIHGASDRLGAYPATDPVTPDDLAATMFWALGIDPATELCDTLGRPLPIAADSRSRRFFPELQSMPGEGKAPAEWSTASRPCQFGVR